MKDTDCYRCRYADVSGKPRTVVMGNMTLTQNGGAICRCPQPVNMRIDMGGEGFRCSEFKEKGDGGV